MCASVVISPLKGPKHGESILEQSRSPLSIAFLDLFNQNEQARGLIVARMGSTVPHTVSFVCLSFGWAHHDVRHF